MLPPKDAYGVTNVGRMLLALKGDRSGFSKLKGILIVADSTDHPAAVFERIRKQIAFVGGYPVPATPSTVAARTQNHPAVAVTLLPDDTTPGGLETLCVMDILERHPWAATCLDSYLNCDQIVAGTWPAEKLGKARYHCLVAALNRDDPARAVSQAFRGENPVIDLGARCFDGVFNRLAQFCSTVGVR